MATLLLEPEFFVDLDSSIKTGPILIEDGRVKSIGVPHETPDERLILKDQVLMPGFVNGHSHSFQRALRGLVEKTFDLKKDTFWSWRNQMYGIANSLTSQDLLQITKLCYLEMLEAGFTHVGEFHYLHHEENSDPLSMSEALVKAAKDSHINLTMLMTAYNRYSFDEPIKPSQRRFFYPNVESFLDFISHASKLNVDLGLAIHSVRAVPKDWFLAINDHARRHKMPLHIHASEQLQEVEDCQKHHSRSPIKLLADNQLLAPYTTLVHATHLIDDDVELIKSHKPNLCICPSTEKNLGDGMIPLKNIEDVSICIGTDQHVRFDAFDEVRSLEEEERLRLKQRAVLTKPGKHLYEALHPYLSQGGLKALYPYDSHLSMVGKGANLISLELPPEYYWHGPKVALDAMMLSYHPSKIQNVLTNGHFVVQNKVPTSTEKPYLINNLRTFFKKIFIS